MMEICGLTRLVLILAIASVCSAMEMAEAPKPIHDITLTDISAPSTCKQGDIIPIVMTVANQGSQRETFRVMLIDDTSGKRIANKELALAKAWTEGSMPIADAVFDTEETGVNYFGNQVWMAGDINGDGYDDILISAPNWSNSKGRVYLFYGNKQIDTSSPDMVFSGEDPNTHLGGYAGTCTCDMNKDGYDDIIIGARGYKNYDGRVCIYYGGPEMDANADIVLKGEAGTAGWFGLTVATGDVDNDGNADVLVGAQYYDQGRGRVYLFWGGGESMDTTADVIFEGEGYPEGKPEVGYGSQKLMVQGWFGRKIDAAGDVNGDGYNDILVGARHAGGSKDSGCAYLFFGNNKEDMDNVCDYAFRGEKPNNEMGSSLELFDIDADGFYDIVVGARFAKDYRGAAYIWWGGIGFNGNRPADVVLTGEPGSNLGGDGIVCGYFNGDQYGDILVGAYNYPGAAYRHGRAYLFYGSNRASMDTACDLIFRGCNGKYHYFGVQVSCGDANNDGYSDVIIGEPGYLETQGRVHMYYGPFSDIEDVTLTCDTTNTSVGTHTLKAEIPPVEGEQNTEDNVKTVNIEVKKLQR